MRMEEILPGDETDDAIDENLCRPRQRRDGKRPKKYQYSRNPEAAMRLLMDEALQGRYVCITRNENSAGRMYEVTIDSARGEDERGDGWEAEGAAETLALAIARCLLPWSGSEWYG